MSSSPPAARQPSRSPSFAEAVRFWLKLGWISFGGPAGQIAILQTELVERRRWIDQDRFLHALNFCMLLPGPEAQQLAIYIGWALHRTRGALVAGTLFVLPSMLILWGLSFVYVRYGSLAPVAAIFYGLKPMVLAIVAAAVIRIGRKALRNPAMWAVAVGAFFCLSVLGMPFPLIVLGSAAAGWLGGSFWPAYFASSPPSAVRGAMPPEIANPVALPNLRRTLLIATIGLALWWTPVVVAGLALGWESTLAQQGLFFSKAAVVTFGGAYAVLPYVAQQAVETHGWLAPGQMLDGLGLAETTPGPLIMVLQFVGFLGGWNHPGIFPPLAAATLSALMTTWVTFVPCFIWILIGAPYVERLRDHRGLTAALATVTAAVVGVVLSLALWFGLHVIARPGGAVDPIAALMAAVAFVGLLRWRWSVVALVIAGGAIGFLTSLIAR